MSNSKPFGTLPKHASRNGIEPFTVDIPEEEIQQMLNLLKFTRVAGPIYENSLSNGERTLGVRRDWLLEAKRVWQTGFDWRESEAHINSFPNFKATVQDELGEFTIHFAALFSSRDDAVPVVLLHGWPGSFLEFLGLLDLVRKKYPTPDQLPYHVIVPSLPGYAFSSPAPLSADISQDKVARVIDTFMKQLGFESGYVAQGGDVGSRVARVLGAQFESCKAVHVNMCLLTDEKKMDMSNLSESEKAGIERFKTWRATGMAYAMEQGTKPATLGFVLNSNPLAVLAWIGEKFLDWTDSDPSIPTILEAATLYYLTACTHSNIWSYRHSFGAGAKGHDHPDYYIKKPMGYSLFPKEILPCPASWVKQTGNLVWDAVHDKGGHFAALEQPELLLGDVEAFVGQVWSR